LVGVEMLRNYISSYQMVGLNCNIKVKDKSLENMAQFWYLGMARILQSL
jgi:hypothetical protein